jgi:FkbM family methyltransferase
MLAPVESLLYEERGVPFQFAGHAVRVLRGCPLPIGSVYRRVTRETQEDLAFMTAVLGSLRPGDRFLDVGANFGLYTLGAAAKVGGAGKVVAFEPTPASAELVRRNAALNGFSRRVEVHAVAVSDGDGTVEFSANGTSCQNAISAFKPFQGSNGRLETLVVPTVALDSHFDPAFRTVAKIDVEGAELLVLRGAPKLLASPARIFVELHAWGWSSVEEGWAELQALARATGRTVRAIDGALLDRPTHERVELARDR